MELSAIEKVLGGNKVLRKSLQSQMDLVELGNQGVTKDALTHLAEYFSFSVNQMAQLLSIPARTIKRQTPEESFNRTVSEQILQIAKVVAKGSEVFAGKDEFQAWINHPNKALSNKTPISLLMSKFGSDMVLDELGRIEHGVFS